MSRGNFLNAYKIRSLTSHVLGVQEIREQQQNCIHAVTQFPQPMFIDMICEVIFRTESFIKGVDTLMNIHIRIEHFLASRVFLKYSKVSIPRLIPMTHS